MKPSIRNIFTTAAFSAVIALNISSLVSSEKIMHQGLINGGGFKSAIRDQGYVRATGSMAAGALFMPGMEWMETLAEDKPMYADGDLPKTPNDVLIGSFVKASRATLGDAGGAYAIFAGMAADTIVSIPGSVAGFVTGVAAYELSGHPGPVARPAP
jgi:hypothetical protein